MQIADYADKNDLILISKDADFKNTFYINQTPRKLIKINLGNIPNQELIVIIGKNLEVIKKLNYSYSFILELDFETAISQSF
jgi:predicted nuclease of predicted toxin-antitoxin system